MRLLRLRNPDIFQDREIPEAGMDLHFGAFEGDAYAIIGERVAVKLDEIGDEAYPLDQEWRKQDLSYSDRKTIFEDWLRDLPEAPRLEPIDPGALGPLVFRPEHETRRNIMGFIVGPLAPLPAPPPRPSSIYGHLPFGTVTESDTLIYRWEAFPTSRRITRTSGGGEIARDTYAAPASEIPFAPTGFAAVARFALPNLMPACFRWEIQPDAKTFIECGASVPLYGQSGGGVEIRFPHKSGNRCPIADPVLLPPM